MPRKQDLVEVRCYNRAFVSFPSIDVGAVIPSMINCIRTSQYKNKTKEQVLINIIRNLNQHSTRMDEVVRLFFNFLPNTGALTSVEMIIKFKDLVILNHPEEHLYVLWAYLLLLFDRQLVETVLQLHGKGNMSKLVKKNFSLNRIKRPYPFPMSETSATVLIQFLNFVGACAEPYILTFSTSYGDQLSRFADRRPQYSASSVNIMAVFEKQRTVKGYSCCKKIYSEKGVS